MKKIYLTLAAVTAMLFTACTQSEDITQNNTNDASAPQAVQFGTYLGKVMRAGNTGDIASAGGLFVADGDVTVDKANGFGVFAYLTDAALTTAGNPAYYNVAIAPNFMYNQQVKANTATPTDWTYTPIKYWPNGEDNSGATQTAAQYLSFFAYAPYVPTTNDGAVKGTKTWGITAISANTATSNPVLSYTLDKTNFVDLLWGTRNYTDGGLYGLSKGTEGTPAKDAAGNYYNVNLTKQNTTETVDFAFKHALAKIGGNISSFQIQCDIDKDGEITGGTKEAETFITVKSVTIKNDAGSFVKSGQFDIVQGRWTTDTPVSVAEGELIDITSPAINGNIIENNVTYADDVWKIDGTAKDGVTTTPQNLFATAPGAAYFIPGGAMKLLVTIQYVVRTRDVNLSSGYSEVTQTIKKSVNLSALNTPNKYYKILIHLGLTSVKFTATVSDWEAASAGTADAEISLPANVKP